MPAAHTVPDASSPRVPKSTMMQMQSAAVRVPTTMMKMPSVESAAVRVPTTMMKMPSVAVRAAWAIPAQPDTASGMKTAPRSPKAVQNPFAAMQTAQA